MAFERNTKQRDAVRTAFEKEDRPLSPEEVLKFAKKQSPGIGIATVYRAIKVLVEEGWLTTVNLISQPDRYERSGKHHHHHFRCKECDKVYELEGCLHDVNKLVPKGFKVESHHIIFDGTCAECR